MQNQTENLPGELRVNALPQSISKTLNARSKAQLTTLLEQVCALQKQYGKTPAELEVLVEGFSWVLADHSINKIMAAMREYIQKNSDIPAPADILKIIEMQAKPPVTEIPIETLLRYQKKGIPLSQDQINKLKSAGYA